MIVSGKEKRREKPFGLSRPKILEIALCDSAAVAGDHNIATLLDDDLYLVTTTPLINNNSLTADAATAFDTRVAFATGRQADGNVVAGFAAAGVIHFECGLGRWIATATYFATTAPLAIGDTRLLAALISNILLAVRIGSALISNRK